MNVSLSDHLVCPRCGPEWGLVLLPDEVKARRVETGSLGCPGCRSRYAIERGVARLAVGEALEGGGAWRPEDGAVRLAGLLGLGDRRGVVLLGGPATAHGAGLARLVEGAEVVLAEPEGASTAAVGRRSSPGAAGAVGGDRVSRLEVGSRIPLRNAGTAGVALTGGAAVLAEEGIRVLGPGARILLDPVDDGARDALISAGLRVVAEEGAAVLAVR